MMSYTDDDPTLDILYDTKYDTLNANAEYINKRYVRIDRKEKKIVNQNFTKVMDVFISSMKEVDSTFKDIYGGIKYTGSFFDNLKISRADEYDVNIILRPKLKMAPARKKMRVPPGHVLIQVLADEDMNCVSKPYVDWLYYHKASKSYFLKINEVTYWFQGIVTKAKEKIENENLLKNLQLEIHGTGRPAWTLDFKDQKRKVSIDLVPCLEFCNEDWPKHLKHLPRKPTKILRENDNDRWYAVPKGPRNAPGVSEHKYGFIAWRISCPSQEKHIISNLNYFKYTLRLLKKVRDQLEIYKVASYYIKTLFLWEIERIGRIVWRKMSRGRLFMYMLVRFQEALVEGRIDFFWDPKCNLIEHVSEEYLTNKANQVDRFIRKIEYQINRKRNQQ